VGTLVLNNDFRHPVILAQELAALDLVTGGRLEIGLGAGWARDEYEAAGFAFGQPGKRLARLKESVAIIRQALSEGRVERPAGGPYGELLIEGMPRSIQRPHPPILIGGGGPMTLTYAGEVAQIVGLDPRAYPEGGHIATDVTEVLFDEKVGWLRDSAGDRFDDLELNAIIFDVDPTFQPGGQTRLANDVLSSAEIVGSPHYLLGSTGAMVDALIERRERWGINYLAIKPKHMDVLAPVVAKLAGT
jgi:probable F420-dependent oxidoreductase